MAIKDNQASFYRIVKWISGERYSKTLLMRNDPVGLPIQCGFARRRVGPEIQLPSTSPFQGKKELVCQVSLEDHERSL